MAVAFLERDATEHRRLSWFFAHLIAASGMFKERPNMKRLLENLNAPVDGVVERFELRTKEDLAAYEKRFGLKLTNDGDKRE